MSWRDKSYWKPHRAKQKSITRVQEVQADQRGEGVSWEGAQGASRHERRRLAKGARIYDKIHGEGAAVEFIKRNGIDGEAIVRDLVGRADREGAGGSSQDDSSGGLNDRADAVIAAAVAATVRGRV